MTAVKAHYDGKVIVPDEPVDLPKGQKIVVRIELVKRNKRPTGPKKPTKNRKKKSVLDWIEEHRIDDDTLPPDFSYQLDHYLYGVPKKHKPRRPQP